MFKHKKVTVAITGGIAAYKAADTISWLVSNGADTQVAMTDAAIKLVSPIVFQALTGRQVAVDLFSTDGNLKIPHIDIAQTDLFLVLPATANILAKTATGIADDLISSALLATRANIVFAPAMNTEMYNNPATQNNIELLEQRGYFFIEPGFGRLACGGYGIGRLADERIIRQHIIRHLLGDNSLAGVNVLITAGPTFENLDPVRYIGNRSSGKMGYALAEAAWMLGATVTLISGPSGLAKPDGVHKIPVNTAEEMYQAVISEYKEQDITICSAAVADFTCPNVSKSKIKKQDKESFVLELTPTVDILAMLGKQKEGKLLIGFAAETDNLMINAQKKLHDKNLDFIVANDVSIKGVGFNADQTIFSIIDSNGQMSEFGQMSKRSAAMEIIRYAEVKYRGRQNY